LLLLLNGFETYSEAKPCDAVLKRGSHVRLFYQWDDPGKTRYTYWHEGGTTSGTSIAKETVAASKSSGYVVIRYKKIQD